MCGNTPHIFQSSIKFTKHVSVWSNKRQCLVLTVAVIPGLFLTSASASLTEHKRSLLKTGFRAKLGPASTIIVILAFPFSFTLASTVISPTHIYRYGTAGIVSVPAPTSVMVAVVSCITVVFHAATIVLAAQK